MNAPSRNNEPSRDDAAMRELLLLADRQEIQPPCDLLDRVRSRLHEHTVQSPSVLQSRSSSRSSSRWSRRGWLAAIAATSVVLFAFLFSLQPSGVAWSQVAEAVRAMPWIHLRAVGGEGQSRESWLSYSRNTSAMRTDSTVVHDDYQSGVRFEYDLKERKLYRLSVANEESFRSMEESFRAIFRGDDKFGGNFAGRPIIKQQQRTVSEQGRQWIMYELELQDTDPDKTFSAEVRVDPQKMLPDLMTFVQGEERRQFKIDFPNEGPTDIYALEVPRDAQIEDHMPPADLDQIIRIVQKHRRDFGNYLAVASGNKSLAVHLIRCKGDKFRVDVGIGDTKHVTSEAEMAKWWREHGTEILPEGSVLCDGRRVYDRSPESGWCISTHTIKHGDARAVAEGIGESAPYFIDLLAYPPRLDPQQLASSRRYTASLDLQGANGPPGSARVEVLRANEGRPADRSTYHKEEFWLQPEYGYAVVKHVFSECPEVDEDPLRIEKRLIYEYGDFRQTPRGVWFPTVSRWKATSSTENENEPGDSEFYDQVTYFHVDFTSELPDELFSPEWQGDLLSGINFSRRDDASKSNDLGTIRPPGGVPLRIAGPDRKISVDGLSRVKTRLEAVPAAVLEKWVVELERIIDIKLKDGIPSAKQTCRTDFVIHMSVAFDDLKWNARTADELFHRAESLPASEARTWKEAFELLLNQQIGQTDTSNYDGGPAWAVPLVLIPVDSLYEGQKYSIERGRKYLARLKQLTADDVTLWREKVDEFGGTTLDAVMNIILLDDHFDNENFQRDRFLAAIEARKK